MSITTKIYKNHLEPWGIVAWMLLMIAAGLLHNELPDAQSWSERQLALRFQVDHVPDSRLLRMACLGHQGLVADLLLIRTVLGFSEMEFQHHRVIKNIPWFHNVLDIVTDLDPQFRSAYVLGGGILALRDSEDYRLANRFLKNVALEKWDAWQVPAWIGFNHYFMKEYEASIPWFHIALQKGAPSSYSAYLLATTKLGKPSSGSAAIQILRDYLLSIDDPSTRTYLELRLQRMLAVQKIREAAKTFLYRTGKETTTIGELIEANLISPETVALFEKFRIKLDHGQFRTHLKEQLVSAVD